MIIGRRGFSGLPAAVGMLWTAFRPTFAGRIRRQAKDLADSLQTFRADFMMTFTSTNLPSLYILP